MIRRPLGVLLLLAATTATPVDARSLAIERFDVEVFVHRDASIEVTETIVPGFTGSWSGIYRMIPTEYRTARGFNYTLFLKIESVTDADGRALKTETTRERHYRKLKIFVPDAVDTTRTVKLRYRVEDALRFFEDNDELYWNVTGDEWEVPIESAAAVITLPPQTTGLRAQAFSGIYGSIHQGADVQIVDNEVRIRMRGKLGFHEGLTAVVGWDKGSVDEPGPVARALLFARSNWPFALPLCVLAAMSWLWWTRGRDPRRKPVTVQYAPPDNLTPGEVGVLVDNSADMRDVTATLVDLAVRGYLKIEEKKEPRFLGLWSDKDYVFHMQKKRNEWQDLKAHEQALLEGVFAGSLYTGLCVTLSDLQNRFYTCLPDIRDGVFDELLARGYYPRRPDRVRTTYLVTAGVTAGVGVFFSIFAADYFGLAPLTLLLAFGLSALVIAGFGWFMPVRTAAGAGAFEGVLGFEEFLGKVEADRIDRTMKTPETFEKYLPFAMALGVEKNWVRAFDDIYRQPPTWYTGGSFDHFTARSLMSDLSQMSTSAAAVMASSPRSSEGSGFSSGGGGGGGGGSSGGGFGGGGGGGF